MLKGLEVCLAVSLAALLSVGMSWSAEGADKRCDQERQFSGTDYWFWQGYQGITDVRDQGNERLGRMAKDPSICFRAPLAEINDWMQRLRGYKGALKEGLKLLFQNRDQWDAPEVVAMRKRVAILTGHDFASFPEFQKWWLENNDYVVWSDAENHLVVDEAAKAAKTPIATLDPVYDIAADEYWFYEGHGWLKDVKDEGGYLRATAWAGDREKKIQVPQFLLAERAAKRKGYLQAVETIVEHTLTLRELGEPGAQELMQRLRAITAESFQDRQSWITWWNANKKNLVLSGDGQRLIAGPRSP